MDDDGYVDNETIIILLVRCSLSLTGACGAFYGRTRNSTHFFGSKSCEESIAPLNSEIAQDNMPHLFSTKTIDTDLKTVGLLSSRS